MKLFFAFGGERRPINQASTGLIFKSVVQKPVAGDDDGEEGAEVHEGMFRFVVLYLKRFKDSILVSPGTKLEVT